MCYPDDHKITVIIPVHNGGMNFRKCLSSLAEAKPPPNEIIVVEDGITNGSSSVAEEYETRIFRLPESGGPARARNLGARMAEGDILFFVDADVSVCADALSQVSEAFSFNPDLVAAFGSYDDEPGASNFLSQFKNLFHHYVHQTAKEEASTFWGACGAIRKDIFLKMGGFDEGYTKPSVEDIELGYRLKKEGHSIRLIKSLQVKHLKRWGLLSLLKSDIFQRALPWTRLILHTRLFVNDLNLEISGRISVFLIYGLLGAFVGALLLPGFVLLAGVLATFLFLLNADLYRFFHRKRGLWFALRSLPWHWLYFSYSGFAFAIGTVGYLFGNCFMQDKKTSHGAPWA